MSKRKCNEDSSDGILIDTTSSIPVRNEEWKNTKLTKTLNVYDVEKLIDERDMPAIANLISERFSERYLKPAKQATHGFARMALCCLSIESYMTYFLGYPDSENRSKKLFVKFFAQDHPIARSEIDADAFYKCVRCGILHQGETTGGWRIKERNKDELYGVINNHPTIYSRTFRVELELIIEEYIRNLAKSPWNYPLARAAQRKLCATICACKP
jgi:hypothetical protein